MKRAGVKVGVISLGCAKNLVDSEIILGDAVSRGMTVVSDTADADVVIINTCGFIDAAKEESIDAILEAARNRDKSGRGQKLIVAGCLSQRFVSDLAREIPEVDAFMGLEEVGRAGEIIESVAMMPSRSGGIAGAGPLAGRDLSPLNLVSSKVRYLPDYGAPRFRLTPAHFSYVKIAEGCNHPCTFCVIPQMRGRHRSRTVESVVREVRELVGQGVREFNLISQDTTYFGMDRWAEKAGPRQPVDPSRGPSLVQLIEALDDIPGDFWVRLLYTHPAHWGDPLIRAIGQSRKVVPYIDMPLQHIHPRLLRAMRRETSREHIVDLIARIRQGIPGVALRTTFIVGFPGETEEEFEHLLEFIGATRFERMGVFAYSPEEGSRAAKLPDQISAKIKSGRVRRAMMLQRKIASEHSASMVGRTLRVLVETPFAGRTWRDAPEIDGKVVLEREGRVGEFCDAAIIGSDVYDLHGRAV